MRSISAATVAAIFCSASCANHVSIPTPCCDSSFFHARTPAGWTFLASSGQRSDAGLFDTGAHGGRYAAAIITWDTTATGAGLVQVVSADRYRGKRIRLAAWLKETANTNRENALWMRVATDREGTNRTSAPLDGLLPSRENAFGISKWQQRQIVIDVPADATTIAFGVLVIGERFEEESAPGPHELFVDDFRLDIVDANAALAGAHSEVIDDFVRRLNPERPSSSPVNLDFETAR